MQKLQPDFSLKCVDAYDDSAVILKWSDQDLQVSHDDMAQYAFLGGKFSSELESFSGGMSGRGAGGAPHMKGVGMLVGKETDLGGAKIFWTPKRDHVKTQTIYIIFILFLVQP